MIDRYADRSIVCVRERERKIESERGKEMERGRE